MFDQISDDEDFVGLLNIIMHPRQPKVYRNRPNQFEIWNDNEFRDRFRLSKPVVEFIVNEISDDIRSESERNHALTCTEMVLLTLRFLACGSFLQIAGDTIGMHKSTASRTVDKVTRAIARLAPNIIRMPSAIQKINETKQQFFNICRFPRCIGAVDCTHIKIQSPGGDDAENYRNRKGFFSINTQVICNAKLEITNIVCRWPEASHDAHIFRNSTIKSKFENREFDDAILVGDSGYGVQSYMMTPLAHPQTPAEQLYNESQIRTRNTIERCFGVWKRRFPILSLGIRVSTEKVEAIVVATAVLHNIAIAMNDAEPTANEEAEAAEAVNIQNIENPVINGGNGAIRNILITDYFQHLLTNNA